jgi:hypothetical protein
MRRIELVPIALVALGLGVPLIASAGVVLPLTVIWVCIVGGWAVLASALKLRRSSRLIVGIVALPLLVLAGWEGGWWLIPAVLAQLAIDAAATESV